MPKSFEAVVSSRAETEDSKNLSPLSLELVVGLVGYAGAGCSTATRRLETFFEANGYRVEVIKLSSLIEAYTPDRVPPVTDHGIAAGASRFRRASTLQDLGDEVRRKHGHHAVASLAVKRIMEVRDGAVPGSQKIAFLLDSLKHVEEVELLRRVYDQSFRLVAVHCERTKRERRLIGNATSSAKYAGVQERDVLAYMDRDEKDQQRKHGQQVRDAFYIGDFFLDNNASSREGENLNSDIQRFVQLLLGSGLVRPTTAERAMYHAHSAGLQSSCLSRQVGAALVAEDGTIVATGTNDVPKFGGGVYDEESDPDNRCFMWEWNAENGDAVFIGCHNQRKKNQLRRQIAEWLANSLAEGLAKAAHPIPKTGTDTAAKARDIAEEAIRKFFRDNEGIMEGIPGVKDLVEYSRSIHAEMTALFAAARSGVSPRGTTLFSTTYPCHNCARHLVTAGVKSVQYIEPYVKSLAQELHSDSILTESSIGTELAERTKHTHMTIVPFTGVGPRMYEDFFRKRIELKKPDGSYNPPPGGEPPFAVRLRELELVEERAVQMMLEADNG